VHSLVLFVLNDLEEEAVKSSFRLFAIAAVATILSIPLSPQGYAQNPFYSNTFRPAELDSPVFENITLTFNNTSLHNALATFSKQTGIILVYSMDDEMLSRRVNTTILFKTPIAALKEIISGTGLEIMLSSSGRIVLVPRMGNDTNNGGVMGWVLDHQTGNPIPRVNIYVEELQVGTVTNNEGRFVFQDIPYGQYTIRATHVAYEPVKQEIFVSPDDLVYESLLLNPAIFNLGDIYIDDRSRFIHEGGLGVSGTTIDQNEITTAGRSGVGQVLRTRVAGVTFFEYGAGSGSGHLQFRGVGSFHNPMDYVRINVDGIPVDGIFWETFVTDNLSRIEILRGPQASGQYGANAMSGVINLYTDTGKEGTVRGRLSAAGGLVKSGIKDFDPLWQEYFGSVGGGSDVITSGISLRHTRDAGVLVDRESRLSAVTAGTKIKPSEKFSVRGSFRFSEIDSGWPYSQNTQALSVFSLMNPDVSSKQQRGVGSINIDLGLFNWWTQKFTIGSEYMYGVLEYHTHEYAVSGENGIMQERWVKIHERDTHIRPTIHYNSKFTIPLGGTEHATFSGGVEVQREDRIRDIRREEDNLFERIFNGESEQTIVGKYLSWSFHSAEDLDVSIGFRIDQVRAEGKVFNYPVSPSLNVGYRFHISDTWLSVVRGSVGRGIRHPHYSMIFGRPPTDIPNPDLSAEIMDGWEAGMHNHVLNGIVSFSATYFSQDTRDAFQSVPVKDELNSSQWINGGRVTNRGLELEANVAPLSWMQLGIAHIFHWNRAIDLRQTDPHEFTLLRIPDIAGSFYVVLQPTKNLNLNFDLYYVGERLDIDIEAWHQDGRTRFHHEYERMFSPYLKVDFFGRYMIFEEHEIFLNIYNIFNDMSREYGGLPPSSRMLIFGLRYNM
jgi:outer membrane receptor protein involved in Fe transport